MTYEEFQTIGRGMIAEARVRFRDEAMRLCHTDTEREKAARLESAIGEVSPEEALLAFERWLHEARAVNTVAAVSPPQEPIRESRDHD